MQSNTRTDAPVGLPTTSPRPRVSVVVPVYGCEGCLRELHSRLVKTLELLVGSFEIVLVNDASPQLDWKVIRELASSDPRVRGVNLSRNFGQHFALAAGLDLAEGDWVVVMDCDLQNLPEDLPAFWAATKGVDAVFGRRVVRRDSWFKRTTSRGFYRFLSYLADAPIDPTIGNYSMISRKVVLAYRRLRESQRNYGFDVHSLGFRVGYIPIEHASRHAGESSYSLRRMIAFALETIVSQSNKPLHLSIRFGFAMSLFALLYGAYLIVRRVFWVIPVEGWTSVMVSLFFIAGLLFANLGVIGLYLGSVFRETKGRPLYIVAEDTADPSSLRPDDDA